MKHLRLNRPALAMLAVISFAFASYFPLSKIRAASASATILSSAARPLVNLKSVQGVKVSFSGSPDSVAALQAGTANPTALASTDFDADGAIDVVAGYATPNGGVLALFKGNPDAFVPKDLSLYQKAMKGQVPPTFLPKAAAFALPESPDFIVTGDFNRDGYKDVLVGARGGSLYFLAGDGRGNLSAPQPVALADQVVALAATPGGHVAVSTDGRSGPQVTILSPSSGGLSAVQTFALPARGTSLEWGSLGGGADLAVAAGSNVVMIYSASTANAQSETVSVPFNAQALTLGDFIWDRDGRTEIAALASDGSIHILQHGKLDTRPVTAADVPARRKALRMGAKGNLVSNPTGFGSWTVAKQLVYAGSATTGPMSSSALSSPRLAASSTHDVMVIDAARSQLNILDTSGKAASPSAGVVFSGTPVAALALPQKIDSGRDIVVLTSAQVAPMLVSGNATLTLNVNTAADIDTVNACAFNSTVTTPPATLSLREAVCIANNNGTSTVTINVPAGTYSLAISTFGGRNSASSSGELQVGIQSGNNIMISGAGAGSTIIQQTNGIDRVIEADELLNGNQPLVIQSVTIQNGTCTDSGLDCDAGGGGGAILAGGPGDPLTLTNVTLTHNSAISPTEGMSGGALYYSGTTVTIGGSTFSNNSATSSNGGGGGGAFVQDGFFGSSYLAGSLTITNSTFTGNTAKSLGGGLDFLPHAGYPGSVSGSTFTGNTVQASGEDGGGIFAETFDNSGGDSTFTMSNSRIVGNTATNGSGYYGNALTNTVTNNWWGCNGGPGLSGCDTVVFDLANGGSGIFNPWLVLNISANPTSLESGQTSALTADLTHNSNGIGGFSAPNGTAVTFGGTLDSSVNPTNTTFTSGQATSTYTAGATPGAGSGTAVVDNQTVSVTINIGAPPTITSVNSTTFTLGLGGSFTVTTSGSPTPSLSDGGATLPSGVSFHDNGNGTATLSGTPGNAGSFPFTITASNGFTPNATQNFTLFVNQGSTSISVASVTPNSEVYGQNSQVTITAVLSWSGTGPAPTASDVIINGTGPSGYSSTTCGAPSGDTLTCTATYTPTAGDAVGSYTESASFSGDSNYTSSSSTQTNNFSITQATSSTSVGSSQNPSLVGQSVTFTATIDGQNGEIVLHKGALSNSSTPKKRVSVQIGHNQKQGHPLTPVGITGTVTWSANTGCSPGSVSGNPGTSQCTTTSLPQGTDTITATYSGDNNHSGSAGTLPGGQVVNPSVTATSIAVTNVNPSSEAYGQDATVTITAVLSWTGSGPAPTASDVTIGGNGTNSYSATTCGAPSGDTLTCAATYTPTAADIVGSYTESASFSGDSNYSASSSTQTNNFSITQATSSTSVSSNLNPSMLGQSVMFTATINGQYGFGPDKGLRVTLRGGKTALTKRRLAQPQVPTGGTVTWSANTGCSQSTVPSLPGTATCTTSSLPLGNNVITATYSGDVNHTESSGTLPGGQQVNGTAPTITSANNTTFALGSFNSFTVTTTGDPTPSVTESGTMPNGVGFIDNGNGTGTLSGTPTQSGTFPIMFTAANGVAPNAKQNFTLTVSGAAVKVNPTNIAFGTAYLGGAKMKQGVTVTNTGTSSLVVSQATVTPGPNTGPTDFTLSNYCVAKVAPGKSCSIFVIFSPNDVGSLSGTLNIYDNAAGSPQQVTLSGTVINPVPSYNPPSLAFGGVKVGNNSMQSVTLTNTGTTALDISSIVAAGKNPSDFQVNGGACPSSLAPTLSCQIDVTFAPTVKGARSANITVVNNAKTPKQTVPLSGKGQ